jgi:hypothetical protein
VKDFNQEIISDATKVKVALELTKEDSITIAALKTELEKTYKVLELSRQREEKSK